MIVDALDIMSVALTELILRDLWLRRGSSLRCIQSNLVLVAECLEMAQDLGVEDRNALRSASVDRLSEA